MSIPEHCVETWEEFNAQIFSKSWNEQIGRNRSNYVFRGLSDKDYKLKPSLNRICGDYTDLEKSILRNFRKYATIDAETLDNFWKTASLGQHHGLPTRLLDWTFSPYVAAHFATSDLTKYDVDCVIWCVDFVKCHKLLPIPLKKVLDNTNANSFSIDMLDEVAKNYDDLKKLEEESGHTYPLFFEPPSIDGRIVNQYALFSVMSDVNQTIHDWLSNHPNLCFKIIIPADKKLEFRDRLDQINITERTMYPGLDGLCQWLSRHYKPSDQIGHSASGRR